MRSQEEEKKMMVFDAFGPEGHGRSGSSADVHSVRYARVMIMRCR